MTGWAAPEVPPQTRKQMGKGKQRARPLQRDDRDRKARLCQLRMGKFDELQRSLGRGYERSLNCPHPALDGFTARTWT